ncbi:MAG: dihydrodipicolinate synthase family protein [Acidobacteriota bacterium]|nr:dihydrodipicolinate synthase family protein [Acidobacteriota bacterium]
MTRNEIIKNLEGVICPIATPFNRRGEVDKGQFLENISKILGIGLAGILVAGSTGEAPYLAEDERLRLVELAREVVKPPEILLAGTGLEGTAATIKLSREAVARGADALLVLTPNYFKARMDSDALVAHYRAVGAGVKRPVMVYSIPQFTGLDVDPATIGKLSRLPNVVGLKESSGNMDFLRAILSKVRPGFRVMVGAASIFYEALSEGAVGAVLGLANFAPSLCVGVYEAYLHENAGQARDLQQRLLPLGQKISVPFGVAGVKVALDLCGYHGGIPRLPLLPVSAKAKKQIAAALHQANAGLAV